MVVEVRRRHRRRVRIGEYARLPTVIKGLPCRACLVGETKVVDSRAAPGHIRRRRECLECKTRYSTREIYAK